MRPLKHAAKAAAALLACGVLACALTGCTARLARSAETPRMPYYQDPDTQPYEGLPALPYEEVPASQTGIYGSVGLLAFPSVLVSVYLDEAGGGHTWTDEGIARSRANLAVAVDWINEQCAAYNASARITCDDGTDEDLFVRMEYNGRFRGGVESDEDDDLLDAADLLCEQLDTAALRQKYGTSSIGFLYFLPLEGSAFTMVHYAEDGSYYYYEYSILYEYDAYSAPGTFDSPAVYAHEILHLYGAPDLYDGSSDLFVSPEMVRYVSENWPTAIMQDTYSADGGIDYDFIDRSICPITAYRLGLCTDFEGLELFPALAATRPGVFEDEAAPDGSGAVAARAG